MASSSRECAGLHSAPVRRSLVSCAGIARVVVAIFTSKQLMQNATARRSTPTGPPAAKSSCAKSPSPGPLAGLETELFQIDLRIRAPALCQLQAAAVAGL